MGRVVHPELRSVSPSAADGMVLPVLLLTGAVPVDGRLAHYSSIYHLHLPCRGVPVVSVHSSSAPIPHSNSVQSYQETPGSDITEDAENVTEILQQRHFETNFGKDDRGSISELQQRLVAVLEMLRDLLKLGLNAAAPAGRGKYIPSIVYR